MGRHSGKRAAKREFYHVAPVKRQAEPRPPRLSAEEVHEQLLEEAGLPRQAYSREPCLRTGGKLRQLFAIEADRVAAIAHPEMLDGMKPAYRRILFEFSLKPNSSLADLLAVRKALEHLPRVGVD